MTEWIKIGANVPIQYVPDEEEPERDFEPSFRFNNRRYYLDDFTRTHNNPWIGGGFPEYIHGVEAGVYYKPLFIELIGDVAVNIYEEKTA